jgi:hypothetical protein
MGTWGYELMVHVAIDRNLFHFAMRTSGSEMIHGLRANWDCFWDHSSQYCVSHSSLRNAPTPQFIFDYDIALVIKIKISIFEHTIFPQLPQ